jgi:hypothetical protein
MLHDPCLYWRDVHDPPTLPTGSWHRCQALPAALAALGRVHFHLVRIIHQAQGTARMSWLATGLASAGRTLALGMGLDARPIRRRRLAAVMAVRGEARPQPRVLLLQSDDSPCEIGHKLANKRDDRVWASLIGF